MSKAKFFYLAVFVFSAVFASTLSYFLDNTTSGEQSLKSSKNLCESVRYDDPAMSYDKIKARQEREMYGYSEDMPIAEAVKEFNEEMRCHPQYSEFPELSEAEVIASLIDFDSQNNQPNCSEKKRKERNKIISEKILPKGSLLKSDFGGCVFIGNYLRDDLCAKGLKITLLTNLDKSPDAKIPVTAENVFIIKKTFVKYQPRNQ